MTCSGMDGLRASHCVDVRVGCRRQWRTPKRTDALSRFTNFWAELLYTNAPSRFTNTNPQSLYKQAVEDAKAKEQSVNIQADLDMIKTPVDLVLT